MYQNAIIWIATFSNALKLHFNLCVDTFKVKFEYNIATQPVIPSNDRLFGDTI